MYQALGEYLQGLFYFWIVLYKSKNDKIIELFIVSQNTESENLLKSYIQQAGQNLCNKPRDTDI